MSSKAMSLKGRIKNYAKSNNIAAQVVLQNYMFECFLARLFFDAIIILKNRVVVPIFDEIR